MLGVFVCLSRHFWSIQRIKEVISSCAVWTCWWVIQLNSMSQVAMANPRKTIEKKAHIWQMCALSSSLIAMNMHIKSPQMFQCVKRKIFYRMHTVNKWKYHIMSLQPKPYSVNQVAVLHLNVMTVFLVKIAILETDSNLLIWWITCTSACKLLELAPGRFGIPLHQTSREGKYVEWISNVEESHGFRRMPLVLLFFFRCQRYRIPEIW